MTAEMPAPGGASGEGGDMTGRRVRWVALTSAGLVLGALAVAGCSGSTEGASGGAGSRADGTASVAAPEPAGGTAGAPMDASTSGKAAAVPATGSAAGNLALQDRSVVRTASLTLRVPDVLASSGRVSAIAAAAGGFVAGEKTQAEPDQPAKAEAVLTVRVPAARLPALLTQLHGLGTLISEEQSADDVTGQVIDVQARIAAQKASVARISTLMAKATTLGQAVQIEGELTARQAALESLEGQAAALADQTTLATVTATLVGPATPVPVAAQAPTGFGAGLSKGWHAFTVAGTWLLTAIGALLPFVLLLAPFVALLAWLARRRRTVAPSTQADPRRPPRERAGGSADQTGVDDHVVAVVPRGRVDRPTAGHQPQRRVVHVAVDELGRELRLEVADHTVDGEHRDAPVCAGHQHPVGGMQAGHPPEDRGALGGVEVAHDDRRPQLTRRG